MATVNQIGLTLLGQTGTGNFVGSASAALVTPVLGDALATSISLGGGAALSRYDQGTWLPIFLFSTLGNLSVSYATQTGSYTRIGNIMFLDFLLTCTPTWTTSSGNFRIGGIPTVSTSAIFAGEVGSKSTNFITGAGYTYMNLTTSSGSSFLQVIQFGSARAFASITSGSFTSGIQISIGGSIAYNV